MLPIYILGLLLRYGPQHGYQLKKRLEKDLHDFTHFKLPTLYYHLDKLKTANYICPSSLSQTKNPEKTIYEITVSGINYFKSELQSSLTLSYQPTFDHDALLYFSDYMTSSSLLKPLKTYEQKLNQVLIYIEQHQKQVSTQLPKDFLPYAQLIFTHHKLHYKAELEWCHIAIHDLKEVISNDQTTNSGNQ